MDADFVLVDVVLTKDAIPIVMKDPGLKRMTNINSTNETCTATHFIPEFNNFYEDCYTIDYSYDFIEEKITIDDTQNTK